MKKISPRFYLAGLVFLLGATFSAQAETKYVSDQLIITVRTGQGAQYQIIKTLKTGEHVEVLETTETGYTRVRTSDGTEGWVRSQYLIDEPVAMEKLQKAMKQLNYARTELKKVREKYTSLKQEHKTLSQQLAALQNEKSKLDSQIGHLNEVAKKPILLDKQNRELQQKNITLEKDLQRLNQENQALRDRSQREWFIAGALVLFGGILLGLIIPKLRRRKRDSW